MVLGVPSLIFWAVTLVIAIKYVAPRPILAGVGVHPGTTIVTGSFSGNAFHGRAWVFSICGAFDYLVDGGLAPNGDLVVEGLEPDIRTDCGIYGAKWGRNSHLVFTEVGRHLAPPPAVAVPVPGAPAVVAAPGSQVGDGNSSVSKSETRVNSPDTKIENRPVFSPNIQIVMPPGQPASQPPQVTIDGHKAEPAPQ